MPLFSVDCETLGLPDIIRTCDGKGLGAGLYGFPYLFLLLSPVTKNLWCNCAMMIIRSRSNFMPGVLDSGWSVRVHGSDEQVVTPGSS